MPARKWDDPWKKYPPSVPLPVEGGVATSRQRGPDGHLVVVPAFR